MSKTEVIEPLRPAAELGELERVYPVRPWLRRLGRVTALVLLVAAAAAAFHLLAPRSRYKDPPVPNDMLVAVAAAFGIGAMTLAWLVRWAGGVTFVAYRDGFAARERGGETRLRWD